MKALRWVGIVLIILIMGCNKNSEIEPDRTGVAGDGNLNSILNRLRTEYNVPSLGAMLVVGDSVLESEAAGERSFGLGISVTKDDQWHIGAITKAMTATLAALLVEEGMIDWETTIGEVFTNASYLEIYKDVKLEDLLYHVSGVPNDVTRIPSWHGDRADITDIVALRKQWTIELLNLQPDVIHGIFNYSNGGYITAGAMLEEATGKSWESLIQDRLFGPLGMQNSGFGSPGIGGNYTQPYGHYLDGKVWVPVEPGPYADNPPALGPAGTVHSTLQDISIYLRMHKDGANGLSNFLTPESFQKLHTAFTSNYAMGWETGIQSGNRVLAHNGSNTIWFAEVRIEPERNFVIMVATNGGNVQGQEAIALCMQLMITRFEKFSNP